MRLAQRLGMRWLIGREREFVSIWNGREVVFGVKLSTDTVMHRRLEKIQDLKEQQRMFYNTTAPDRIGIG